jgi:hypothetical protein
MTDNSQYPSPKEMAARSSDRAKLLGRDSAATAPQARRDMSAQVQRLARRLGKTPEEIAAKIPAETLRRTKYPVIETVNPDGTRSFKHDWGIEEGRRHLTS